MNDIRLRAARPSDAAGLLAIYAPYVEDTAISSAPGTTWCGWKSSSLSTPTSRGISYRFPSSTPERCEKPA